MVFFQAALLVGYSYAHLVTQHLRLRRQTGVHLALLVLPLLALPIALKGTDIIGGMSPAFGVIAILALSVGLPYVVVTATSPLLQRWFSSTGHKAAADPYFLYSAGNAGSLLGLLLYPFLVEPWLAVHDQGLLWSAGYILFAALCATCAVVVARRGVLVYGTDGPTGALAADGAPAVDEGPAPTVRRRGGWTFRAFVPASLLLGVTTHLETDIAAVPLLWVIPLAIYLVTFILAFSPKRIFPSELAGRLLPVLRRRDVRDHRARPQHPHLDLDARRVLHVLRGGDAGPRPAGGRPPGSVVADPVLPAHRGGWRPGRHLQRARGAGHLRPGAGVPHPARGGAAAAARRAPLRPPRTAPATRSASAGHACWTSSCRRPWPSSCSSCSSRSGRSACPSAARRVLSVVAAASLVMVRRPVRFGLTIGVLFAITFLAGASPLFADRTFFGVHRVIVDGDRHVYLSGATIHGAELITPDGAQTPLSYYHRTGPAGQVFAMLGQRTSPVQDVGVIGLGAGALAAYGEPGQAFTFYEIDPVVMHLASDPSLFTYLRDSKAAIQLVEGDGRLRIATGPGRLV